MTRDRLAAAAASIGLGLVWAVPLVVPDLWPVALLYLIPAAWAAERWSGRRLACGAFLAGAAQMGVAGAWMLPMGPPAYVGLILITAVPMLVGGRLYAWARDLLPPGDGRRALLFPAALFILELLRARGPVGWTWHHYGHGLAGAPAPLIGLAAWVGLHGVGWALAAAAAAAVHWRLTGRKRAAFALQGVIVLFLLGAAAPLGPAGTITVRAVASGLDTREAWDLETFQSVGDFYARETAAGTAEAVAWPESALVSEFPDPRVARMAADSGRPVLYGAYQEHDGVYSNVYGVTYPDGTHGQPYRKRIIVPMGERVLARPLVTRLFPGYPWPQRDVMSGPGDPPLDLDGRPAGPLICWEALFPRAARERVLDGAEWLVVAANTSWFTAGSTRMTARFTRFRAVETGRGVLTVVTGGGTSLIDTRGRLLYQAPMGEDLAVDLEVPIGVGTTPFTVLGDWPLLGVSVLTLASLWWRRRVDND